MKLRFALIAVAFAASSTLSFAASTKQCGKWMEKHDIVPQKSWGDAPASVKEEWGESDCNTKVCKYMVDEYDVKPNKSWGSLPADLQKAWTANSCNDKVD